MDLQLKGKRVLVTGASKGIGRACVEMLEKEGCTVLGTSRGIAPGSNSKAADLSLRGVAEELAGWAGDLDILVNNAGAIPGGDLERVDEDTWRKAWDLKVFGYINLTRAVYAAMKAFTRTLGGVSHADGIHVLGINPGPVATDRLLSLYRQMAETKLGDPARYEELFKEMSFGRPATAEEIASAVAFLASERSAYTSGCILSIDGGLAARWG